MLRRYHTSSLHAQASPGPRGPFRGYSLIELLLTLAIIQMIALMVGVQLSSVTSSERVNFAAQETIAALRYARQLSLSTGTPCGVIFDDVNQKIIVFRGNQTTIAPNPQIPGGQYVINLKTQANVLGVSIKSITLAPTGTKTVLFGKIGGISHLPRGMGSTSNTGYVQLGIGSSTRTIAIPQAGEPKMQ